MSERMTKLAEDAAVDAVTASIRRLFTTATDRQVRDLARAVLRDLAAQGLWLSEPIALRDPSPHPPPARGGGEEEPLNSAPLPLREGMGEGSDR